MTCHCNNFTRNYRYQFVSKKQIVELKIILLLRLTLVLPFALKLSKHPSTTKKILQLKLSKTVVLLIFLYKIVEFYTLNSSNKLE